MKAVLAFLAFLLSGLAIAQTPMDELHTQSNKAKKLYLKGEEEYIHRNWDEAAVLFEKALKADKNFPEPHLRLGYFQIISTDAALKQEGIEHLKQYMKLQPNSEKTPQVALNLAKIYADSGKYQDAAQWFQYIPESTISGNPVYEKLKKTLDFYSTQSSNVSKKEVKALPQTVNSLPIQYNASLTGDGKTIFFTGKKGSHPQYDENIYESTKNAKNDWQQAKAIQGRVNTAMNEGSATITADGRTMVFTGCERKGGVGSCDLYISHKEGELWGEPINLQIINSKNWDSQPSLSADGRDLYFCSNRPHGLGGYDIWVSHQQGNNKWSVPENLGSSINTTGNEYTPFIHANNMLLYFATDGRPGMGNLDLFYCRRIKVGWENAINLGLPINTNLDESSLVVAPDGKNAYFNEEIREKGISKKIEIMEYPVPQEWKVRPICTYVRGKVFDAKTKQTLMAQVQLIDLDNDSTSYSVKADPITGNYLAIINSGNTYGLFVSYPGYLFSSTYFEASDSLKPSEIDFPMVKISKGGRATLNNLFFDFNKATLRPQSISELKRLSLMMLQNPTMNITIEGHTDDVGTDIANQALSEKRAQSVSEYLVSQKVPASRLKTVGYGKTRPKVKEGGAQSENRRIEFVVN